ncbi:MAG TPA: hypothetical protein VMY37_33330 [Thermoguttaceae bacterium]|nr:hypothetical protein [Thermoguttaceae bacterium]
MAGITWPDGKQFAFSVFDDTDRATLDNVPPVYALLADLGLRTTKSVWPIQGSGVPAIGGATCEDPGYLRWVLDLAEQGFEIGLHNATYHTSSREETLRGLDVFRELFGADPRSLANHAGVREGIYWGANRVSGWRALAYHAMTRFRRVKWSRGHVEGDPLFWGDLCRDRVKYVRNFVFREVDTLEACPQMPYRDPARPYVNYWFASSEGANVDSFNRTLCEEHQDRLQRRGGACVMYTHFANGFYEDGRLNRRFRELMERLAAKNGWFVPVSRLLDHILQTRGPHELTPRERARLERKWLLHKLLVGTT